MLRFGHWCFYATEETQMKTLACVACVIFCNDVLFSPTHERSIIVQILMWPVRDLWKTFAVVLSGMGIHQLSEKNYEEALWCAVCSVSFLLISPVYMYNQINHKIGNTLYRMGAFIKNVLTYYVVRPGLFVYDGLKYVLLLRWMPGLRNRFYNLLKNIYYAFDRTIMSKIRAAGKRCGEIMRYWVYFYWLIDLKCFLSQNVMHPFLDRLRFVGNYFIYVFGGYWFAPMMRLVGRLCVHYTYVLMAALNQCVVASGNSVIWPLVVLIGVHLQEAAIVAYDVTGRPVVDIIYQKCKYIEDFAFIYFVGPTVKTVIECIPEKNPFVDENDSELEDFLPGPMVDEVVVCEETDISERSLSTEPVQRRQPDDLDDDSFLAKRLQRNFSGSDSSDEEFMLFPKRSRRKRV